MAAGLPPEKQEADNGRLSQQYAARFAEIEWMRVHILYIVIDAALYWRNLCQVVYFADSNTSG